MKNFELKESNDGWHTLESDCEYHYRFPKSYPWVMRQVYLHQTFYGKGYTDLFRGECETFRIWSSLISAIAVPLDE